MKIMKTVKSNFRYFVVLLPLCVGLSQADASPQEVNGVAIEAMQEDGPEISGEAKGKVLGAKQFQLRHQFANEINLIDLACKLDKKQKLKLKIGAKGAVKKLANQWLKRNEGNLQWMINPGGPIAIAGDDPDESEDKDKKKSDEIVIKEIKDFDEIESNMIMNIVMDTFENPFASNHPVDSPFWKKIVKGVLTDKQKTQLIEFKANRKKRKTEAILNLLIQNLTAELTLNEEQQEKIRELIRPKFLKAKPISTTMFAETYFYYYYASKVRKSDLKKILTDEQIQQWKLFMAPAQQVGQMIEMENGMGANARDEEFFGFVLEEVVSSIGEGLLELFAKRNWSF